MTHISLIICEIWADVFSVITYLPDIVILPLSPGQRQKQKQAYYYHITIFFSE